jgi:hypothetical protein
LGIFLGFSGRFKKKVLAHRKIARAAVEHADARLPEELARGGWHAK